MRLYIYIYRVCLFSDFGICVFDASWYSGFTCLQMFRSEFVIVFEFMISHIMLFCCVFDFIVVFEFPDLWISESSYFQIFILFRGVRL